MESIDNIYVKSQISKRINLLIWEINDNLKEILEFKIKKEIEGKCIIEGYVKKDSIRIVQYSNGNLSGKYVTFEIIVECLICNPYQGMLIQSKVKNITKAGVRCEVEDNYNPIVLFINRDYTSNIEELNKLNLDDIVICKVIGQRYELNDEYISVIADLNEKKKMKPKRKLKE